MISHFACLEVILESIPEPVSAISKIRSTASETAPLPPQSRDIRYTVNIGSIKKGSFNACRRELKKKVRIKNIVIEPVPHYQAKQIKEIRTKPNLLCFKS